MAQPQKTTLRNGLFSIAGFVLVSGLVLFSLWAFLQIDWLLWASGAAFSVFLLMPALLLAVNPNLAISYINSVVALPFLPKPARHSHDVYLGPIPRLFEITKWDELSTDGQISLYLIVLLCAVLALVVMRYTFGPALWQQAAAMF